MSAYPVLKASFPTFRDFCAEKDCYSTNRNKNKKTLLKEFRTITKNEKGCMFDDHRKKAFKLAEDSCLEYKDAFAVDDRNTNLESMLVKGCGHWQKAAALHYYLLETYEGIGARLNKKVFDQETIENIFEYEDPDDAGSDVVEDDWTKYPMPNHALLEWERSYRRKISEALKNLSETGKSVLLGGLDKYAPNLERQNSPEGLVGCLFQLDPITAQEIIQGTRRTLMDDSEDDDADCLRTVLDQLAPSHLDDRLRLYIAWARDKGASGKYTLVAIGGTLTRAEIAAAAIDGQPTRFRKLPKSPFQLPVGEPCLSTPPESGRDPSGALFLEGVVYQLSNTKNIDKIVEAVETVLRKRVYGNVPHIREPAKLRQDIKNRSELHDKRKFYLPLKVSFTADSEKDTDEVKKKYLLQIAARLAVQQPDIHVIPLDQTLEEEETHQYMPLAYANMESS